MKTFPQLCATICINEVEPRLKKHGYRPPADIVRLMVLAEFEGGASRADTRRYLDGYYRMFGRKYETP